MNQELAMRLKEMAFPLNYPNMPEGWYERYTMWWPTLEELIHECGPTFFRLEYTSHGWYAGDSHGTVAVGETPHQAVAELWIERQKQTA